MWIIKWGHGPNRDILRDPMCAVKLTEKVSFVFKFYIDY